VPNPFRLVLPAALVVAISASAPTAATGQARPAPPGVASTRPSPPAGTGPPAPAPAVVNSWALTPAGSTPGEPGARPNLSYEMAPGARVDDAVTLLNYSNVTLTFRVYATDAFNNVDGQFDLLPGDRAPVDAGAWVTLPQANITVPAQSAATLPITVVVPPDAAAGDHGAAILASVTAEGTGSDGKIITLDRRTGSRLYLRVAGPLTPGLDIENIRTTYRPALNPLGGEVDTTYTVRNTGNVRLAARQRVTLHAPFGVTLDTATPADVPELLPGGAVTLTASFKGIPATGLLTTRIALAPRAAPGSPGLDGLAERRGSRRVIAIPWTPVALVLAAGLSLRARRAYRRHQAGATGKSAPMQTVRGADTPPDAVVR
jgi:hypothetical protein